MKQKKLSEFEQEKSTFLSSIFKGGALSAISEDVQNMMEEREALLNDSLNEAQESLRALHEEFEQELGRHSLFPSATSQYAFGADF